MRWNLFPFLRYVIALSAGTLLYHWGHFSFQTFLIISGTALIAFLGLQFTTVGIKWLGGLAGTVFCMGLGGLITHTSDEKLAINHFTPLQDSVIAYRAVLSSAVEKKPSTYRVIAEINAVKVQHEWRETQGKILLFIDRTITHKPRYGDVWLIRKRPELVEPPSNPDEFNYQAYLGYQGIYHQQYVHAFDFDRLGNHPPSVLLNLAYTINDKASSLLAEKLPSRQEYAVAAAMLLGVREELDYELLQAYSAAGAIHTLSVSGMHVGILFLVLS